MNEAILGAGSKPGVLNVFEDRPHMSCSTCSAVLALQDELISKSFTGREGTGFLLNSAVNVRIGKKEERQLMTGVHTVADVFCIGCNSRVGWHYLKASDTTQKYKEGKYLFERERLVKNNAWKLEDLAAEGLY